MDKMHMRMHMEKMHSLLFYISTKQKSIHKLFKYKCQLTYMISFMTTLQDRGGKVTM